MAEQKIHYQPVTLGLLGSEYAAYVCSLCGSLVVQKDIHNSWHISGR